MKVKKPSFFFIKPIDKLKNSSIMILANYLNTLVYETTFRIIGVKIGVARINAVSILTAFFFIKKILKGGYHVCDELNF